MRPSRPDAQPTLVPTATPTHAEALSPPQEPAQVTPDDFAPVSIGPSAPLPPLGGAPPAVRELLWQERSLTVDEIHARLVKIQAVVERGSAELLQPVGEVDIGRIRSAGTDLRRLLEMISVPPPTKLRLALADCSDAVAVLSDCVRRASLYRLSHESLARLSTALMDVAIGDLLEMHLARGELSQAAALNMCRCGDEQPGQPELRVAAALNSGAYRLAGTLLSKLGRGSRTRSPNWGVFVENISRATRINFMELGAHLWREGHTDIATYLEIAPRRASLATDSAAMLVERAQTWATQCAPDIVGQLRAACAPTEHWLRARLETMQSLPTVGARLLDPELTRENIQSGYRDAWDEGQAALADARRKWLNHPAVAEARAALSSVMGRLTAGASVGAECTSLYVRGLQVRCRPQNGSLPEAEQWVRRALSEVALLTDGHVLSGILRVEDSEWSHARLDFGTGVVTLRAYRNFEALRRDIFRVSGMWVAGAQPDFSKSLVEWRQRNGKIATQRDLWAGDCPLPDSSPAKALTEPIALVRDGFGFLADEDTRLAFAAIYPEHFGLTLAALLRVRGLLT